ncbi:MAG: T9SS type A sorting domain-containing protein, partial [Bacteroidetes bacterium]|nr:T9SS type A sorting domain-containing protein [Bacteroidota bacterium]
YGMYVRSYPNPFTSVTTIEFSLGYDSEVVIEVFDISGKLISTVFSGVMTAGDVNAVEFNNPGMPEGMYIYKMSTDKESIFDKFTLIK